LRLRDLAAVAGLHPSHLARSFRSARGESLAASLRRRRVEWAKRRLVETDDAIATVALEAGFCDQGHFSRVFRRIVGTTPSRFRNSS
jgi:AraC family transcriptional regulator